MEKRQLLLTALSITAFVLLSTPPGLGWPGHVSRAAVVRDIAGAPELYLDGLRVFHRVRPGLELSPHSLIRLGETDRTVLELSTGSAMPDSIGEHRGYVEEHTGDGARRGSDASGQNLGTRAELHSDRYLGSDLGLGLRGYAAREDPAPQSEERPRIQLHLEGPGYLLLFEPSLGENDRRISSGDTSEQGAIDGELRAEARAAGTYSPVRLVAGELRVEARRAAVEVYLPRGSVSVRDGALSVLVASSDSWVVIGEEGRSRVEDEDGRIRYATASSAARVSPSRPLHNVALTPGDEESLRELKHCVRTEPRKPVQERRFREEVEQVTGSYQELHDLRGLTDGLKAAYEDRRLPDLQAEELRLIAEVAVPVVNYFSRAYTEAHALRHEGLVRDHRNYLRSRMLSALRTLAALAWLNGRSGRPVPNGTETP